MNDYEVKVTELPNCDLCASTSINPTGKQVRKAEYDGKTRLGPWANMCRTHFREYGIGLGLGKGQRLILVTAPSGD